MLSLRFLLFTDLIKRTFSVSQWFIDPMQLLPSQIAICFTVFSLALSCFLLFLHLLFLFIFCLPSLFHVGLYPFSFHVLLFQKFYRNRNGFLFLSTLVLSSWREFPFCFLLSVHWIIPFIQVGIQLLSFCFHFRNFPVSLHSYDAFGILRIGSAFFFLL